MSFQETDRIAKLIPADLKMTVDAALSIEPDLRALYDGDERIRLLLNTSRRLEGLSRHASIHAAGLVISDRPMVEYLPVYRGKREEDVVTQFDRKRVEKVGLVKFDFLGLRNMTVIDGALRNIVLAGGKAPDLDSLPLDDAATYRLYSKGDTDGVFQVESSGMRAYLRQLKPSVFEDIIAMLALYRPGPLKSGMVTEFIQRKQGKIEVSYPLPCLQDCLKDTYGVIVYQEQVMQIAQIVAGYTLGGADLLRRAMGKKDPAAMAAERSKFVNGAVERGVEEEKADEIFDLMEKFAEYGFNKSHSAAYALISYQTAWLKTHYPTEFMAALLSSEMGDQNKLLKYLSACRNIGVSVKAPSIQDGIWKFHVRDGAVDFGLGAIKSVGEEAVKELVAARQKDGPFHSLLDLCSRVSLRKITKRVLENLIKGGACDCFGVSRAGLLASLDAVVARAQKKAKARDSSQMSLLSMMPEESARQCPGIGFDCPESAMPEWDNDLFSRSEKEALGFFLTSHPLQLYKKEMIRQQLTPLEDCRELPPDASFKCAALIQTSKIRLDPKNRRWALLQIEDLTSPALAFCFSDAYEQYKDLLLPDTPLYIEGRISRPSEEDATESAEGEDAAESAEGEDAPPREIKFIVKKILLLADACKNSDDPVCIVLAAADNAPERLEQLKEVLNKHKGKVPVHLMLHLGGAWCRMELSPSFAVSPGLPLEQDLDVWARACREL
jgi:DNA polymerase-3 subunit alpha